MVDQGKGANISFDPDALHKKYQEERDKRLANDAPREYAATKGAFAKFGQDPNADPDFKRDPIESEDDVLIIGGGIAGLLAGARLRLAGVESLRVVERGGDFGGTWYWNRYPGAACDVESYVYMPLLEEVGTMPSEKYAKGPEIFEHLRKIGRQYRLYDGAIFQTEVKDVLWDEGRKRWIVITNRGDHLAARFVYMAIGSFSQPKLPLIPGIETFAGHAFHTSRWDYGFTGGNTFGNLTGLANKSIAVVGTGATGVQVVPKVAESAGHVYVVQRTPAAVDVRGNKPTSLAWWQSQEPGWQKKRMDNFDAITLGMPQEEDLVNDNWTDAWGRLSGWAQSDAPAVEGLTREELLQLADYEKMEEIRARVDSVVQDPKTAAALKPYYNLFCKRPGYHDEYLQAFNRPNVSLVDTDGKGIERITPKGFVVKGVEYPVDCIAFATGFDTAIAYNLAGGFDVVGREGQTLADKWAGGIRTLHGMYVHGFPNLIVMGATQQAAVTINYPSSTDEQAKHLAEVVRYCLDNGIQSFEPKVKAEDKWQEVIKEKSVYRERFEKDCTPGYYNNEGDAGTSFISDIYGGRPFEFRDMLSEWRNDVMKKDINLV